MRYRALVLSLAALMAALVSTLLVSTPADAATLRTWERVAHCESTSRWHVNTHNGYYGGLQISGGTWRAFHGGQFASLPHRATKAQQIRVAERIKRVQGWRAWPSCSARLGLR